MPKKETLTELYSTQFMANALVAIGGFIDAYTFVQRGGVMAAGQTGNIIFMSVNVVNRDFLGVKTKLATMLAFALGCFIGQIIKEVHKTHYWRIPTLILETLVFFIVGWLPTSLPNVAIVPALAFVMAMQTTTFNEIEGQGYNNVFSTGNLKKSMVGLASYLFTKNRKQLKSGLTFLGLVLSFAIGAMISAVMQNYFGLATIWWACGFLALLTIGYMIAIYRLGTE
ncbi:YoaK family protein [Lentilactobacillus senioris]|uniref:YoaK family protein n=1 Tax=Lentilactobacillus senioris TaxID=931534 RepID=UPI0022804A5A|nr:YoaK family protein [Lentilactobacillus senioris]MCY9807552.1 YoaK family protein [Lentilactobacillus senioris]